MEKRIVNVYQAQHALRDSGLPNAKGIANYMPQLIKVKEHSGWKFLFYWEWGNFAYDPVKQICGCSGNARDAKDFENLLYEVAKVGDHNKKARVVDFKGYPAVEIDE